MGQASPFRSSDLSTLMSSLMIFLLLLCVGLLGSCYGSMDIFTPVRFWVALYEQLNFAVGGLCQKCGHADILDTFVVDHFLAFKPHEAHGHFAYEDFDPQLFRQCNHL